MNIKTAAKETRKLIGAAKLPVLGDTHCDREHLFSMVDRIVSGEVSREKALRWLGWIQACIVLGGSGTVYDMKAINKEA